MLINRIEKINPLYIIIRLWIAYIFWILLWKIIAFFYIDFTLGKWYYFYAFIVISIYQFLCQNWLYDD